MTRLPRFSMTDDRFHRSPDERVLVCDGAMGTMLYAQGVFINKSFDALNLTQPELVERRAPGVRARRRRHHRDQYVRRQPHQARRRSAWPTSCTRSTSQGARIARRAAGDRAYVAGVDRAARHPHRAVGQDRRRRGARVLPRAGAGAARGRRRSVHPRDVPRPQRDRRGHRRRAVACPTCRSSRR